jgi:hypothetical protein
MSFQRGRLCAAVAGLSGLLAAASALAADLGPAPQYQLLEPPPSGWTFTFTPYGWLTGIDGNVTARGHTVDINENFFQIAEQSDSLIALMGYFEARKGRFGLFADVVWADLGFPGSLDYDIRRKTSSNPFARIPRFKVNVKGNLKIAGDAQLDYQQTIIQSGVFYEVAKWPSSGGAGFTAFDLMASARYWSQDTELSLDVRGDLNAEVIAGFQRIGLDVKRNIKGKRATVVARSGDLEWVDPVVGGRVRHQFASGSDFVFEGDVGGFGAGSEFSWQAVATYGFDVRCFGTPLRTVVGYRALFVDYSENTQHGKSGVDWVEHGPLLGVSFRW